MVNCLRRVFVVLEALNEQPVVSLQALRSSTRLPKPTLVRLLKDLVELGYAYQVSSRDGYALAQGVLRLTAGLRQRDLLVDVARPLMAEFTREHRWQVALATFDHGRMYVRTTTRYLSPYARDHNALNRRIPVVLSAHGRSYLAACSRRDREAAVRLAAASEGSEAPAAPDPKRIEAMVKRVRDRGYAITRRRDGDPHWSMGVAVTAPEDAELVLGTLVMSWYRSVMTERQAAERHLDALRRLAQRIASDFAEACEMRASQVSGPEDERSAGGFPISRMRAVDAA